MFRSTTSKISTVSGSVAYGRQTLHHVSASPPFHPGRSDFPSPVGDLDHLIFLPIGPSQSLRNLSANSHTSLMRLVYPTARHLHEIPPGLIRWIPLDAHQDREPLCPFRIYPKECDFLRHIGRRYPPLIAPMDSCARPKSSVRLRITLFRTVFAGCR